MNMFVESFDSYNGIGANTGLLSRWTVTGAALSGARTGMVTGRFGVGQAFNSGSGSSGSIHRTQCTLADRNGNPFTLTSFALHCAMRPKSTAADGTEMGFVLGVSGTGHLGFRWLAGRWQLVRWGGGSGGSPAAVLWQSDAIYSDTVYRSFSAKGTIHASTGTVALKIDGTEVCNLTGQNTGTGAINEVAFHQGNIDNGAGIYMDDLVVVDTDADYLPDLRIDQLRPNADGGVLGLVPSTGSDHYAMVDEEQVTTADFLQGSTVGDYDLLGLPNLSVTPASILGVNLVGFAGKTDVTARSWNMGLDSGGTVSNGDDLALATSAASYYHRLLQTDPNTAAAWLKAGVDGLQLRPRVAV